MDNLNSCNDINILVYLEKFTRLYIEKYTEGSDEMTDCRKCKRTNVKCCTTCERNSGECNVWHKCGEDCPKYIKGKQTNADRIRQMTDEELAEFLLKVNTDYAEPCMVSGGDCKYEDYPIHDKGCKDCFLEYLRKEVEEKDE